MSNMKETERTARHEAAHFVVSWAVDCPQRHVDITPAIQKNKEDAYGNEHRTIGLTSGGDEDNTFGKIFEDMLATLAGPVSDYFGKDVSALLDGEKSHIDWVLKSFKDDIDFDNTIREFDGSDWDQVCHFLFYYVDVLDEKKRNDALSMLINGVRSILELCEKEWREATEYLLAHGRIGYDGNHPDCGEGADEFFCRWGDDWGKPPEKIAAHVDGFRAEFERVFPMQAVFEEPYTMPMPGADALARK